MLSDDRRLNSALLQPEHAHSRTYLIQVERLPDLTALEKLEAGVFIDGQMSRPAKVSLLTREPDLPDRPVPIRFRKNVPTAWLEISLTEGRNRQVRRMTAAVGHPTLRLVRSAIGLLKLGALNLSPGQWRLLDASELSACFLQSI